MSNFLPSGSIRQRLQYLDRETTAPSLPFNPGESGIFCQAEAWSENENMVTKLVQSRFPLTRNNSQGMELCL